MYALPFRFPVCDAPYGPVLAPDVPVSPDAAASVPQPPCTEVRPAACRTHRTGKRTPLRKTSQGPQRFLRPERSSATENISRQKAITATHRPSLLRLDDRNRNRISTDDLLLVLTTETNRARRSQRHVSQLKRRFIVLLRTAPCNTPIRPASRTFLRNIRFHVPLRTATSLSMTPARQFPPDACHTRESTLRPDKKAGRHLVSLPADFICCGLNRPTAAGQSRNAAVRYFL